MIEGDFGREPARRLLVAKLTSNLQGLPMRLGGPLKLPVHGEHGGKVSARADVLGPADTARDLSARLEVGNAGVFAQSHACDTDAVQQVRPHLVVSELLGKRKRLPPE